MHTYPCVPGISKRHKGTLQKCPIMVSHHRGKKKNPTLTQEPAYLCTHRYLHNQRANTHPRYSQGTCPVPVTLAIRRYFAEWSIPELINADTPHPSLERTSFDSLEGG